MEFEPWSSEEFPILHIVKTDSGAHPISYAMVNGPPSPGVKRQRHEADQSHPIGVDVNQTRLYVRTSSWCRA
jgi:hypothetical protein